MRMTARSAKASSDQGRFLGYLTLGALLLASVSARAVDGTWTNDGSSLWSTTTNWNGGTVADGSGATANFNTINITADRTISLDSSRTIGNLIFGDITTGSAASWILDNNSIPGNVLTLAGGTPTITVNAMGTGAGATLSAILAGTSGLTKAGSGALTLSGADTYTGTITINGGILRAGIASVANTSGAFGNNSAVTLANTAGVALDLNGFNSQVGSLAGGGGTGGNVTLGTQFDLIVRPHCMTNPSPPPGQLFATSPAEKSSHSALKSVL